MNEYEMERKNRIAENKARMAQLGLSQTLNEIKSTAAVEQLQARQSKSARKTTKIKTTTTAAASTASPPRRRSGRVQGQPAPDIDEATLDALETRRSGAALFSTRFNEEVYTAQHVAALGSHTEEWTLFVDGYDANGNRIYDRANGQTCHQCRQKTIGLRTACSQCSSLNGVFCGDCLFMRYGENVNEVNKNATWTCPHCRDLCNCSIHRNRRGWAPTGTMWSTVKELGFKSVAHYLVLCNLEPEAKEAALHLMPKEVAEEVKAEMEMEKGKRQKTEEEEEEEQRDEVVKLMTAGEGVVAEASASLGEEENGVQPVQPQQDLSGSVAKHGLLEN